jgi:hypothetical protein
MKKIVKIGGFLVLALSAHIGHTATLLSASSQNTYNFALANGSILPDGGIFEFGYYSSAVSSTYFQGLESASQFLTGWTSLGSSTANAFDFAGLRAASRSIADGITTYDGKSILMIVGNAGTISGSQQIGVFSNSNWVVPASVTGPVEALGSFDISDAGTTAVFGSLSLGTGAFPSDNVSNSARLAELSVAAIPEPSVASLLALGTVGLVALRARRKS